jgi:H+/Cl- antiporter ClcA
MAIDNHVRNSVITPRRLWFGLAASAVAWGALGLIDIVITWRACVHQEQFGNASAHPDARAMYIIVASALFLVVVTAGTMSYRNWRTISQQSEIIDATATDRQEFMALLGVFVSITLGMGVLWLAIPPLMIELCLRAK